MSPASLFLTSLLPAWSGDSVPVAGSQCHEHCLHPKAEAARLKQQQLYFPFFCTSGQKAFHMKIADAMKDAFKRSIEQRATFCAFLQILQN